MKDNQVPTDETWIAPVKYSTSSAFAFYECAALSVADERRTLRAIRQGVCNL